MQSSRNSWLVSRQPPHKYTMHCGEQTKMVSTSDSSFRGKPYQLMPRTVFGEHPTKLVIKSDSSEIVGDPKRTWWLPA
jgi:hypothetical protein